MRIRQFIRRGFLRLGLALGGGVRGPFPGPANLAATPSTAQNALTWDAVAGATAYRIYRGTSSGGETFLISQ